MPIDIETIDALDQVFEAQKWPRNEKLRANSPSVFEICSDLLSQLSTHERSIVLNLLGKYLWCQWTSYPVLLEEALRTVPIESVSDCRDIILCPLISPKDRAEAKTKSSSMLPYMALHVAIPRVDALQSKAVKVASSTEGLAREFKNRQKTLLLFLDDFIGTGDTAVQALNEYQAIAAREKDDVAVVALVSMHEGAKQITDRGVKLACARILKRSISDDESMSEHQRENARSIVRGISDRLRISEEYALGYGASEAVVSMMRTPNNTFPLFWCDTARSGAKWPAPFVR